MKTNFLCHCLVSFFLACQAVARAQPQVITLADGTKLTLLGTTYGRRHLPLHFEDLPTRNELYTGSNATVVWVQADHAPAQWPNYELVVYDQAQTACVTSEKSTGSHVRAGEDIAGFLLDAFPRWDPAMLVRARPYRGVFGTGQFVITNPAPVTTADWTPETLPQTKSDGDLEVTLASLTTGAPVPHWAGRNAAPPGDLDNQCVRLHFDWRQNGQPATNWFPWLVRTTDAVGNKVVRAIGGYPPQGVYAYPPKGKLDGYWYQPGLWPNEPAWKVRLEMTRSSGFTPAETVTFTNLPVRPGTQSDADEQWSRGDETTHFQFTAEAEVNGVHLRILPPLLIPDRFQPGRTNLSVLLYVDPTPIRQDMRLALLQATDQSGRAITTPFNPDWAGHFSLDFPDPGNLKTLNLQLALHQSRYVEFTVRPAKE
jgi:hypothetical protein